ncbi:hypothetical protein RS030_203039 [Cryptosporidium xiaoi]|uniref:Sm domain-containing protein n=2 Tax=Cryptosporidium TaxID=5806 RepID=A0AAV9XZD0_9CRYT
MSSKTVIGLTKFNNKEIKVKLCGGREVSGILRGFDGITNLVLDETVEYIPDNSNTNNEKKRYLGLIVIRGATVLMICPKDGNEIIDNPFYEV